MGECLNDETVADLMEGRLDASAVADVTRHIDRCTDCRRIVADVALSLEVEGAEAAEADGSSTAPLPRGARVGRYVIVECIGAGAMGVVYAARDPDLGRRVALKVLRPDGAGGEASRGARERLLREAQAMAQLSHPNVITIYDVGTFENRVFLAMELVEGGTLGDWLRASARSWRDVVDVFRRAGYGLQAAHAAGLVHRDFKPDNVLVGADGRVQVTDFGLARSAGEALSDKSGREDAPDLPVTMTRTGALVGTPAYMAPEQLAREVADCRSDVFSFCVAFYEALHGERPFWGANLEELARAIERGNVRAAPAGARVPAWLRRVVVRGLRASPAQRYGAMRDLLDALDAGLSRTRRSVYGAALAGAVVAGAGLFVALSIVRGHARHANPAGSGPSTSSAAASLFPTAITDGPPPKSTSAEALAEYARALQKIRDGDMVRSGLEHVTELDPSLAAAHLRFALTRFSGFWELPVEARGHLAKAVEGRQALTEKDALLLRAAQAWIQNQPADATSYAHFMDQALERFPLDAEVAYFAAAAQLEKGDRAAGAALLDRAIALDPAFGLAYGVRGDELAYDGAFAQARELLERCEHSAPAARLCPEERALIDQQQGDCEDLERVAQRLVARDPSDQSGYWWLASASYAVGRPLETVRELLRQRVARLAPLLKARFELTGLWSLAILSGDFDEARARALELEQNVATDPAMVLHGHAAWMWSSASAESGRTSEAASKAQEFLRRRGAWTAEPRHDDYAMMRDPTPRLLVAAREGGLMSPGSVQEERARWLQSWGAVVPELSRPFLWLHGYAAAAETRDDAATALTEEPKYGMPAFTPFVAGDAYIGKVYLLADRPAEALPYLRRATRACIGVESPVQHTQAHLALAQALVATGVREEACAPLQVVLDRWGRAKPRSVTADKARALARSVGCP
jgi:serine/threonine-protein kinase